MPNAEIARLRLAAHGLTSKLTTPAGVVRHLGALQAQDYPASVWAIGVRTGNATLADVEQAVERREIGRLAGVGRWVALLALFAGLVVAHRVWLSRYGDEAANVARVQQGLLAAAKDAGPGRPFGVAALPGQPSLQPGLWGLLAQRPFAPVDLPVSGLFGMLEEDDGNPMLFGNTSPVHADARREHWRRIDHRLVIDLFEPSFARRITAADPAESESPRTAVRTAG